MDARTLGGRRALAPKSRPWFPAEPPGPHLRLSYAATNEQRLQEAVHRLARVAG